MGQWLSGDMQNLFQPVGKKLYPARQMLAVRIKQRHGQRGRAPLGQHLHQRPRLYKGGHVIARNLDQAQSGKAAGDGGLRTVNRDTTGHGQAVGRTTFLPFPCLDPPGGGGGITHGQMMDEVSRNLRYPMLGQIGRRGDIDQIKVPHPACNQTGIMQRADAQDTVDPVLHKVDGPVSHTKFDINPRIPPKEFRQARRHQQPPDPARQVDPQQATRAGPVMAEQVFRLLHICDQAQAMVIKCHTVRRGCDRSGRARQKPRAKPSFQFLYGSGYTGTWQIQCLGRTGKACALHHAGENAKQVDPVHAPPTCHHRDRLFVIYDICCQERQLYLDIANDTLIPHLPVRGSTSQ